MLSWIPLLGPILQGLASIVTPFFNEKGIAVKAAADVTIAETQASVQVLQTFHDDIALRILRDAICLPVAVWAMLMGWDTIVAKHWPKLMWHTAGFPDSVQYIPYVVLVFLFGNIGLNMWNRK
jgi:hypothetical protein